MLYITLADPLEYIQVKLYVFSSYINDIDKALRCLIQLCYYAPYILGLLFSEAIKQCNLNNYYTSQESKAIEDKTLASTSTLDNQDIFEAIDSGKHYVDLKL